MKRKKSHTQRKMILIINRKPTLPNSAHQKTTHNTKDTHAVETMIADDPPQEGTVDDDLVGDEVNNHAGMRDPPNSETIEDQCLSHQENIKNSAQSVKCLDMGPMKKTAGFSPESFVLLNGSRKIHTNVLEL